MSEPSALELAEALEGIHGIGGRPDGELVAQIVAALRAAPSQEPVAASGPVMKALVDWTYLHATEGEQWPSSKTTLGLITKALAASPTQADADAMKAAAPPADAKAAPDDDRMQEDMTLAHNARMATREEAAELVEALEAALREHDYRRDMAYRTSDMLWAVSARAALAAWRGNE